MAERLTRVSVLLVWMSVGALVAYLASAYLGPPQPNHVRVGVCALAVMPGLLLFIVGVGRRFRDGFATFVTYNYRIAGALLCVLLPLAVWITYPLVTTHFVLPMHEWAFQCTNGDCRWHKHVLVSKSADPSEPRVESYIPSKTAVPVKGRRTSP